MMNKKIIAVCVIFILLSTIAVAFFDTIQQSMIFLQEGTNIKLTPNPIITIGTISLTEDISINDLEATGNISVAGDILIQGDILSITDQELNASFLPTEDDKFDIGSSSFRWQNAFFSDVVTAGYFIGNGSQLNNLNITLDQAYDSESGEHLVTIDNGELVFDVTGNDNITIRFDDFDVLVFDPLEYEMRVAKGSGVTINFLYGNLRIPSVNSLPKSLGDLSGFNTSNYILVNSQDSIQVNIDGTKDGWRRLDNNNSGVFGATTFVGDGSLLTGISAGGTSVWNSSSTEVYLNDSTKSLRIENITSPFVNKSYITFLSDGSVGITLDPVESPPLELEEQQSQQSIETKEYTRGTERTCKDGTCNLVLYSGTRFVEQDNTWVDVRDARSLKDIYTIRYIKNDGVHDFEIVDLNYTSITLKVFVKDSKEFNKDIPFKVDDVQKTMEKLFSLGDKATVTFKSENILSSNYTFGSKSTTIILQDADSENLNDDDTFNAGSSTDVWVHSPFFTGLMFNISSPGVIPADVTIDEASLYIYVNTNPSVTVSIKGYSNDEWNEEDGISDIDSINSTILDSFSCGTTGWKNMAVQSWVSFKYNTSHINISFVLTSTVAQTCRIWSKEYTGDTTLRPYLNITYTAPLIPPPTKPPEGTKLFVQNLSGIEQWWVNLAGDMWVKNNLNITGNITTGNKFIGDGSLLTGITTDVTSVWNSSGGNVYLNDSTGNILAPKGVAATPVFSFQSDPSTGIYTTGSNNIRFAVGGTFEMSIDQSRLDLRNEGSKGTASLTFSGDTNTGFFHSTDELNIAAGGIEFYSADETTQDESIFNDDGVDIDFRVETNNNANMFFIDGGNDMVGIGTITPTSTLTVIGNASFTRNISAANVCNPAHFFFHTNDTIPVILGVWRNITFAQDPNGLVAGISHDPVGRLNYSINITGKGVYKFQYYAVFTDSSASPTANIAIRIIKNGIEINGSTFEIDATRQNAEVEISNTIHVQIEAGDSIAFQFIADDLDVSLETHSTFGQHPDSATMTMARLTCI